MNKDTANKLLQLVRDGYNHIAVDFDISRQKEIWPEIINLSNLVKDRDSVLDAGCGNGRLLKALEGKSIDYSGIDSSQELIKLANQRYPEKTFRIMDLLDISALPDNHYDIIFCLAVILHLPGRENRLAVLKALGEKLKSGGQMFVSVWDLYHYKKFRARLRRAFWRKFLRLSELDYGDIIFPWKNSRGDEVGQRYYHAFSKRELIKLAGKAGLKIVDLYRKDGNYWLILNK
jgi:SAM-dependent methyltransferase